MNDSTFPNALASGTRIGPVTIESAIGQGAWGIVYVARHDVFGRVAVKEYFPSTYASRHSRGNITSSAPQWQEAVRRGLERFAHEAQALRSIRHENVVAVLDYLEQDGTALLVMEYIEGKSLAAAIEAGGFSEPGAVQALGAVLVDTLAAIHAKNVLHRDIAPDNIMIRANGIPVLIDFGGAGAAVASATRSTQNIIKDGYSPPEQYDTSASPAFPVGPWSDIYAAAAVLYRAASRNEPAVSNARMLATGLQSGTDPLIPLKTLAPKGFSPNWLAAVDTALALLPKDRPQSAAQWRQCFEGPPKKVPLNRALLAVTAASSVVALGAGGYLVAPGVHSGTSNALAWVSATVFPTPVPTPVPTRAPKPKPTQDAREGIVWQAIQGSTDPNVFRSYLARFGEKAPHAAAARTRLRTAERPAPKQQTPPEVAMTTFTPPVARLIPPPQSPTDEREQRAWRAIEHSSDRKQIQAYLSQFGQLAPHADAALDLLGALDRKSTTPAPRASHTTVPIPNPTPMRAHALPPAATSTPGGTPTPTAAPTPAAAPTPTAAPIPTQEPTPIATPIAEQKPEPEASTSTVVFKTPGLSAAFDMPHDRAVAAQAIIGMFQRRSKPRVAQAQADPEYHRIQLKQGGGYLDADHCGSTISLNSGSTYADGACQLLRLVPADGGYYRIQLKSGGQYLDAVHCGTTISLNSGSTYADGACQLWRMVPAGDNYFRFELKSGGQFLDAAYCGTTITLNPGSTYENGACQLWRII